MLMRRLTSVSAILAAIVCLVIGYVQGIAAQQLYPLGTNSAFQLDQDPQKRDTFLAGIHEVGASNNMVILLGVPDKNDYLNSAVWYSLGANQPSVGTPIALLDLSSSARVEPASQIGHARLNGYYAIKGSPAAIDELKHWLLDNGLSARWVDLTPFRLMLSQFFMGGLAVSFLAVLVLGAMTAMAWYSTKAENRAIRLIAGESRLRIHTRDLLQLLASLTAAVGAAILVGALVAALLWDWAAMLLIGWFALPCAAIWIVIVALSSLLLSLITTPKPDQIANRVPQVIRFETFSQLLKVGALAISLAVLPALALTASASTAKADAASKIAPLRHQHSVTLRYTETAETSDRIDRGMTEVVKDLDKTGGVVLQGILGRDDPAVVAAGFDSVLLVNTRYLELFSIGESTLPKEPDSKYPLLSDLVAGALRNSRLSPSANGFRVYDGRGKEWIGAIAGGGNGGFVVVQRPLVLVTSDIAASVSPGAIHSFITTANITFNDAVAALASAKKHGIDEYIGGVQRVTDTELQYAQFLYRSASTIAMSAVVLAVSVLLGAGISARIHAIRNARRIFVHRSAGATWPKILRSRIFLEGALILIVSTIATGGFTLITREWTWWPLAGALLYALASSAVHVRAAETVFNRVATRSH